MRKIPNEYKKGFVKFLGCKINLSKRPFIPRIETEYWVGKAIRELQTSLSAPCNCTAIKRIKNRKDKPVASLPVIAPQLKVLDMFSGSGCIGIAVLKACSELCRRVDFIDDDERSIEQIKINLKLNKVSPKRYKVYRSDLFEKLKAKTYDVIFANPPYVAEDRVFEVEKSVLKHEPKKALFSGKKGLNHIRRFLKEAKSFLKKEGVIYLEFDPKQKREIKKILEKQRYEDFKFYRDQFNKYRYLKIFYEAGFRRVCLLLK